MRLLVALCLVASLISGCTGSSPSSPDSNDNDSADADDDLVQGLDPIEREDPGEPEVVDWTGSTGTGFCAPSGLNSCTGSSLVSGEDFVTFSGSRFGNVTLDLVLTWDATTNPLAQELQIRAWAYTSCGQGCYQGTQTLHVTGTSPLTLSGSISSPQAEGLFLSVEVPRATPDPVYAKADVDTPFTVEGVLTPT